MVAPQAESSAPWYKTVKQDDQHADLGNQSGEQRMKQLTNRGCQQYMEMSRIDSLFGLPGTLVIGGLVFQTTEQFQTRLDM